MLLRLDKNKELRDLKGSDICHIILIVKISTSSTSRFGVLFWGELLEKLLHMRVV